jgi:hypothetical protein
MVMFEVEDVLVIGLFTEDDDDDDGEDEEDE